MYIQKSGTKEAREKQISGVKNTNQVSPMVRKSASPMISPDKGLVSTKNAINKKPGRNKLVQEEGKFPVT
jgi:hypothetical protein